jgi:hypothetical protein
VSSQICLSPRVNFKLSLWQLLSQNCYHRRITSGIQENRAHWGAIDDCGQNSEKEYWRCGAEKDIKKCVLYFHCWRMWKDRSSSEFGMLRGLYRLSNNCEWIETTVREDAKMWESEEDWERCQKSWSWIEKCIGFHSFTIFQGFFREIIPILTISFCRFHFRFESHNQNMWINPLFWLVEKRAIWEDVAMSHSFKASMVYTRNSECTGLNL